MAEDEPDDNRSLYERLKEQRDTKQEEWEHKNSFKNQVGMAMAAMRSPLPSALATHTYCSIVISPATAIPGPR